MREFYDGARVRDVVKKRGEALEPTIRMWERDGYERTNLDWHTVILKDRSEEKLVREITFTLDYGAAVPGMEHSVHARFVFNGPHGLSTFVRDPIKGDSYTSADGYTIGLDKEFILGRVLSTVV